ncbi:MAG TPA: M20/M25/M40 family metallo-hydrolase [Brumimicrobium sp.]|nr:M20/M25/M40 family metallo-hydrolase [Brumimicrobium sp.]
MGRRIKLIGFSLIFIGHLSVKAQVENFKLKQHIELLSADSLQGRLVGTIGEKMAAEYIQSQFEELKLSPLPNHSFLHDFTFIYNRNPHSTEPGSDTIKGQNVVAYIDNGAEHTFVFGAHYDHLGHNEYNNSTDPNGTGMVHNGADDNASGVAAVLELARIYSSNSEKESVNFIFACFSGEELGLMGSRALSETIKEEFPKTTMMINFDMIGRMDSTNQLNIGGIGTSPILHDVVKSKKPDHFNIILDSSGVGPSDHSSFYYQDIPVLFFFTGLHMDYHKPSDDAYKINYTKMNDIINYSKMIVDSLAFSPDLPFVKTKLKAEKKSASYKVSLGIFPDYKDYGDGLHIQEVIENRTAEKHGFKRGDIITKIGETNITDIYSYMEALSELEKNKQYKVHFIRDEKAMVVKVKF